MRAIIVAGLAVLCATSAEAQSAPQTINLVCLGAGSANRVTGSTVSAWGNGGYASANIIGNRTVPFDDQVNITIDNATGKIRMPRAMLPKFHGGDKGWFELKSVEFTDNEITATVQVNFINSPKLRLDRITGAISISGKAGDYAGHCQKYDPETAERAF